MSHILYLNRKEIESIGPSFLEITNLIEKAFKLKAKGEVIQPPKHWIQSGSETFFSAMSSYIPSLNGAGVKWQSGNPRNRKQGLPYILGLYLLNDEEGFPLAIMDSTWITEMRTAAASALTAKYLARKVSETIGIIGCGLQGRSNLEAIKDVVPTIERAKAYDINPDITKEYCETMSQRLGIEVTPVNSPQLAVEDCDIVVTTGPIKNPPSPTVPPGWVSPGTLCIAIDFDSYWTPKAMAQMDYIVTDDYNQITNMRNYGLFLDTPDADADLAEIVGGIKKIRQTDNENILAFNLGVAIEDLPTAIDLFQRAKDRNIGMKLPYIV